MKTKFTDFIIYEYYNIRTNSKPSVEFDLIPKIQFSIQFN
jgi:hypothetical protein